ncbi:tripartite tricarboxylate transporter substrate binding protein [Ferrovibrio sp.]|uniref:tripartite tricarboxylate transporter substrate binding protein n=1 Tax=Ferrovibrio sp. TaxID=1917215 RepID=UPI0025C634C5|nr:tripartite tricarboxylate transporter substrate binding protein [Ferrovibrio sp.]MBX3456454.1 tripartite tricarboxylate transporter substrate binding protein [Ferrovibrio sp.]
MSKTFSFRLSSAFALTTAVALAALVVAPGAAHAQFPDRPVTLIVPWDAGGSTDQTARVLAKAAEKHLGQPIVVVNKPGAATVLGMTELAAAKPDGYTVGTLSSSSYLIPLAGRQVQYDVEKNFSYVSYYGDNLIGTVVPAAAPWKTLKDLIDDGKKNPGKIKFGTGGVGTTQHLTIEGLMVDTGAKFIHIPQKGSAGSVPALLGNHVDFLSETSVWAPFVEKGEMRLLAVTTPSRSPRFPDAPTMNELGFKTLRSVQGIIGPAGIPEAERSKLESAFRAALTDETFKQTMDRLAMVVVDMPGKEFDALIKDEIVRARSLLAQIKQ